MIQPIKSGREEISQAAVEFELRRLVQFYSQYMPQEEIDAQMDELRQKAREQAIGVRILIREARRQKIDVPTSEVESALQQIIADAGGEEAFNKTLEKQNLDRGLVKESITDSKRVDKLIAKVTADVKDPDETELRAYYEQHREDYTKPEQRRAQHILIKPDSDNEEDLLKAREDLLDIKRQYDEGISFSDLAAAYSQCPSGKSTGGSIGWISRGMMVAKFEELLFSAEIGQVSDIVETPLGFHIVLANDAREGGTASFEEAKDSIMTLLVHNQRGKVLSDFVAKLRAKHDE